MKASWCGCAALLLAAAAIGQPQARAQNLLINPSVELVTFPGDTNPPNWTLLETGTDTALPAGFSTGEQTGFAASSGDTGLWLQEFEGLFFGNHNEKVNATLTQTVAGTGGETYTFKGDSRWEANYSGGVATLAATSPSGAVPSPTLTQFKMEFLNGSNAVLGTQTLNLKTNPNAVEVVSQTTQVQTNDNLWYKHSLSGVAPGGTTQVKVTAEALNMIPNIDPMQSGFFDNFSLRGAGAPATEKLLNADLETLPDPPPPPVFDGWTFKPVGDLAEVQGFAAHTGANGLWLKAFIDGDGGIEQTVAATAGTSYTFAGWSRWEGGYSGGVTTLSPDSPSGAIASPTDTYLQIEFLNASSAVIGTEQLDLRTVQMNDDVWRQAHITATAPVGTASARVSAYATQMTPNVNLMPPASGGQSAFFDDLAFLVTLPGDLDFNGVVDGNDILVAQRGNASQLAAVIANFPGNPPPVGAIPEPTAVVLAASGLALVAARRRRA